MTGILARPNATGLARAMFVIHWPTHDVRLVDWQDTAI